MQLNNFKQMDTKSGTTDIPACFDALVTEVSIFINFD